ncbi:MAG: carboxypeptidase-like regulatory domain-containing protein, partial [Planctomycetes bacterium]|nr:carboxypeptidase-like regulatory domain-containing protein [Planctomycetota bacterium]
MSRLVAFLLALCAIARAQDVRVPVLDERWERVEGATVQALWWSDVDLGGPHATLVRLSCPTDAKGEATLRLAGELSDHACLLAFKGDRAVFACHTPVEHLRKAGFALTLGPAQAVRGRVTDEKDVRIDGARVRLLFAGSYEWHGIDAAVAEDGAFTFAPLPEEVLAKGVRLQARAPGMAPFEVELSGNEVRDPVRVRVQRARKVVGRVVDGSGAAVAGAMVRTGLEHGGLESGADGTFVLADAGTGPFHLHILPPRHVCRTIDVPASDGPHDLGAIKVEEGRTVKGTVREFDGARIVHAFVAIENADGLRVRASEVGPGGAFELPAIGEGPHELDCWVHGVEGVGGSRHLSREGVVAGGAPLDLVVPEGLRVRFVDAKGAPCAVDAVEVTVLSPMLDEPWTYECEADRPMSELRLLLPPDFRFDLDLRPEGFVELTLRDLVTDAAGRVSATATLNPDPGIKGVPLPEFRHRAGNLPAPRFDERSDKDEVRKYVRAIVDGAGERSRWSTADPECDGLKQVGRAHVDVLVDALVAESARGWPPATPWLNWAIVALSDDSSKKVILDALPSCHGLAECVVLHGWQADARDTLLAALRG